MTWGQESSPHAAGSITVTELSSGSIAKPPFGKGWLRGWCSCHMVSYHTKHQFWKVLSIGGTIVHLLCGVQIKLTIGSLPYPRFSLDFPDRRRSVWIQNALLNVKKNLSGNSDFPSYGRYPLNQNQQKSKQ